VAGDRRAGGALGGVGAGGALGGVGAGGALGGAGAAGAPDGTLQLASGLGGPPVRRAGPGAGTTTRAP